MALVLPSTISNPTTGQPILTSWGDGTNDAVAYLGALRPRCSVSNNAVQSVNNATATDLTANTESFDVGGMHSTVTNTARITIPSGEGGTYRFNACTTFAGDVDGYRLMQFQLNGGTLIDVASQTSVSAAINTILNGGRTIPMSAGDYMTVKVTHTAGAALNVILLEFAAIWVAT